MVPNACPNCGAAPANLLGVVDYENGVTSHAYDCGASIEYANGEFFRRIAPCGNQPKRPDIMSQVARAIVGAPSIG